MPGRTRVPEWTLHGLIMDLALLLLLHHGLDALRLIFHLILLQQKQISFLLNLFRCPYRAKIITFSHHKVWLMN